MKCVVCEFADRRIRPDTKSCMIESSPFGWVDHGTGNTAYIAGNVHMKCVVCEFADRRTQQVGILLNPDTESLTIPVK